MITSVEDSLRRDEGSKSSAYQDSRGYWTIGIGTCIDARANCGLTDAEIELLFQNRLALAKARLAEQFPWTTALDEVRLGVLENMVYQMGVAGLAEFRTMLTCLQQGNYVSASRAGLDSLWAKTQSPDRAARLMQTLETGIWV